MTLDPVALAVVVFILRVLNSSIGAIRLVFITRQNRLMASVMAFFEALTFAVTIAGVVTDLANWLMLGSYCGGFAVGNFVGMWVETRFITSYRTVHIIASTKGHEVALALREAGFGVTETIGEGHKGQVTILRSTVMQRDLPRLMDVVHQTNADAFVAVDEARNVERGWVRAGRGQI